MAAAITGVAVVKDPVFLAGDVFLQDNWIRCLRQVFLQLRKRTNDADARATLPDIRLHHHRKLQAVTPHGRSALDNARLFGFRPSPCEARGNDA